MAIERARAMGLDDVGITGPVTNIALAEFLTSIVAGNYGARVYGQSGVGLATTTVEIPVR